MGWGKNLHGQLSTRDFSDVLAPKKIDTPNVPEDVSVNGSNSILLTEDKKIYLSGYNKNNQISDGNTNNISSFTEKNVDFIPEKVYAGESGFYMILDIEGYLYAWGQNTFGQLGDGTKNQTSTPTKIGDKKWKSLSLGRSAVAAIDDEGFLYTWGAGTDGILGNNSTKEKLIPTKISDKKWLSVSVGFYSMAAIDDEGFLYTWGFGGYLQLGNNSTTGKLIPTKISDKKWLSVSMGFNHVAAIDDEGFLYTWGKNDSGQLLNGTTNEISTPTKIGEKKWRVAIAKVSFTILIDEDGYLFAGGDNSNGQLGNGGKIPSSTAEQVGENRWYIENPKQAHFLLSKNNTVYTIEDGILKEIPNSFDMKYIFKTYGVTAITKDDCINIAQTLQKAKILRMTV